MDRRLERLTALDRSESKRSRLLEILLDERNGHLSNRQIARMVLVDESMVRNHRKKLGLKSPEPYSREKSEKAKKRKAKPKRK